MPYLVRSGGRGFLLLNFAAEDLARERRYLILGWFGVGLIIVGTLSQIVGTLLPELQTSTLAARANELPALTAMLHERHVVIDKTPDLGPWEIIGIIGSVAIALFTLFLALSTRSLAKAAVDTLKDAKAQETERERRHRESLAPYLRLENLALHVLPTGTDIQFEGKITNFGMGAAATCDGRIAPFSVVPFDFTVAPIAADSFVNLTVPTKSVGPTFAGRANAGLFWPYTAAIHYRNLWNEPSWIIFTSPSGRGDDMQMLTQHNAAFDPRSDGPDATYRSDLARYRV